MRYSQYFLPTLKEIPSEAEVPSHQLMFRAGMIRKLTSGIYSYLPLGLRTIQKVEGIIRKEMRSDRQMPLNLYQIQTKFRDEIRPRFGLMRAREFMMKDAYSFDIDEQAADKSYQKMIDAYTRIFTRCGLKFRAVEAETGLIGGSFSHEFMVLAETGEETIVSR